MLKSPANRHLPLGTHECHGIPRPPHPPWLVGEVIGTGRPPYDIYGDLSYRFLVTSEERGLLYAELRSLQGLHIFLSHLASRLEPAPGLERLALLGVDRDETMHILHSFFSVPVKWYSTERRLLAFSGEISMEWLPPMTDISVTSFVVWRAICAVTR